MKIGFIDFEASSLDDDSVPIEVGWIDGASAEHSYLILPEPSWTDWNMDSQAVHGITREQIAREGRPAPWVAQALVESAGPKTGLHLCCDGLKSDTKWLNRLLKAAGFKPGFIHLYDVYQAYGLACRPLVSNGRPSEVVMSLARMVIAQAELAEEERRRPRHRALEDARGLHRTWLDIRKHVEVLDQKDTPAP